MDHSHDYDDEMYLSEDVSDAKAGFMPATPSLIGTAHDAPADDRDHHSPTNRAIYESTVLSPPCPSRDRVSSAPTNQPGDSQVNRAVVTVSVARPGAFRPATASVYLLSHWRLPPLGVGRPPLLG